MKYRLISLVFTFILIITIFGTTPLEAQEQGPIIDMHLHAKNSVEGYPTADGNNYGKSLLKQHYEKHEDNPNHQHQQ